MTFLDRIRATIASWIKPSRTHGSLATVLDGLSTFLEPSRFDRSKALKEGFRGTAAKAVNKNASRVAQQGLYVVEHRREDGQVRSRRADEHPVSQLLRRPNPVYTGRILKRKSVQHTQMAGDFFWAIIEDGRGKPAQLHILRPDWMYPIPDKEKILAGWHYKSPDGVVDERFDIEEVVHGMLDTHPVDPYRGASALETHAVQADAEKYLDVYMKAIAESGGRRDFHATAPAEGKELKKTERMIAQRYKSAREKSGIFVTSESVQLTPMQFKPADLSFLEAKSMSKKEISQAFGVPQQVLGDTENANRSDMDGAYKSWNEGTILPLMEMFADAIEHQLLPRFEPGNLEVDRTREGATWYTIGFENPVPEDEERQARIDKVRIETGVRTINEIRNRDGLEPYGDELMADQPWVSSTKLPMELALEESRANAAFLAGEPADGGDDDDDDRGTRQRDEGEDDELTPEEERAEIWFDWYRALQRPAERAFIRMHRGWANEQEEELLERLEEKLGRTYQALHEAIEGEPADDVESARELVAGRFSENIIRRLEGAQRDLLDGILPDAADWADRAGRKARPLLQRFLGAGGEEQASLLNTEFRLDEQAKQWISTQAFNEYGSQVNRHTVARLKNTLMDGIAAGENVDKLARRISGVYDDLRGHRAVRAARTESTGALNRGHDEAIRQAKEDGIDVESTWITSRDRRVRPSHDDLDGTHPDERGVYQVGGHDARHPGDSRLPAGERINCRCRVIGRRVDDDS